MVWPMDPEEEKILRSSSPFVVPEVIVQRNERIKSILKKKSCSNSSTNSPQTTMTVTSQSSNVTMSNQTSTINSTTTSINSCNSNGAKKRVDFHENFCFVNFFDTHNDDDTTPQNQKQNSPQSKQTQATSQPQQSPNKNNPKPATIQPVVS